MTQEGTSADLRLAEADRFLASGGEAGWTHAIEALRDAASLGSGLAIARLARFEASGALGKPDWDRSLNLLQQAAELGEPGALAELRVLAREETGTPAALRRRVDIRDWVGPRPTEVKVQSPRIGVIRHFMTPAECAWVIATGRSRLTTASVYDNDKLGATIVSERNNSNSPFELRFVDIVLVFLHARMSHSTGLPMQSFEPSMLLHYAPGQQFRPHFDYLDPKKPGLAAEIARGGQRIVTLLVYLNEGFEGGETAFPRLDFKFKGNMGDALAFANVDLGGDPDPRTLHAGLPPTRGEKWLLSQWIRNKAAL